MFDEWMKISGTVAHLRSSWPRSSWMVKRPMWIGAVAYAIGAAAVMTLKFRGGAWKSIKL